MTVDDGMDLDLPGSATSSLQDAGYLDADMEMSWDADRFNEHGDEGDDEYEDDDDMEVEDQDDAMSQISTADSDIADLRQDIRRQDREKYVFASQLHEQVTGQPLPAKRKVNRKPRKVPPPSTDILYRLSKAKEAYEKNDHDLTIAILEQIIQIKAETYQAWMLLSTVHEDREDRKRAVIARMMAAQLRHRNVNNWIATAAYVLDGVDKLEDEDDKTQAYLTASACYSNALHVERDNVAARMGKADVLLQLGKATLAMLQYQRLIGYHPLNIHTVRNMADVALDSSDPQKSCAIAKDAYRTIIDYCQANNTCEVDEGSFEWSDLRIYLEFFSVLEEWKEGAHALKEISRWLLGRRAEAYWDRWEDDDREWDNTDERRVEVAEFVPALYGQDTYGLGLPFDLRAKLCVYRLKLGHEQAAREHLEVLDPTKDSTLSGFGDFPDCLRELGTAVLETGRVEKALPYFELYRQMANENEHIVIDSELLVGEGRCYLALGDKLAAEDCFISAIEYDEDDIPARIELAQMYEFEGEYEGREEAFLLVNEAMDLEAQQAARADMLRRRRKVKQTLEKKTYTRRRLLNKEKRAQRELELITEVGKKHHMMEALRARMAEGDEEAITQWMEGARDLIKDFRSFKQFYPWEKYISFMGWSRTKTATRPADAGRQGGLAEMAQRLQQNLKPAEEEPQQKGARPLPTEHRGISIDKWLDMFLEYAIALARVGKARESYEVCHAARDSVMYTDSSNTFLIHLAWATCAIYAGDEETCVAVARYLMKVYAPGSESYRMFAALCRLCQSPVSWYSSGPAQKYFLRQIKTMDEALMAKKDPSKLPVPKDPYVGLNDARADDQQGEHERPELDVVLLTIYGQMLFNSGSRYYSLLYFARALSLDPANPMINLSAGLAYLHHAFQRQSRNRQFLVAQAFALLFRYHDARLSAPGATSAQRQEAHFNLGRAYALAGLGGLAVKWFAKVLDEEREARKAGQVVNGVLGPEDVAAEAAYNIRCISYTLGDLESARAIVEEWLVLE